MLSRDQILQADDLPTEDIDIPEWGGVVRMRTMTGSQRDQFEQLYLNGNKRDARALLAAFTLVNEAGHPMFNEHDVKALSAKSAAALDRILEVGLRLGKVTSKDIEDLEKNSGAIHSGSGSSDSPDSNGALSVASLPTTDQTS